jgi:PKD repeat protein
MKICVGAFLVLVGLAVSAVLAVGIAPAQAVTVDAAPTWPIPPDAPAGPPPIPELPPATDATPPTDEISDPVTPSAVCGEWYLQSTYADRWAAPSTWWEYRCAYSYSEYHNTCPGPACDAFCPSCYWETQEWTDYFVWDGSSSVFYGESYSSFVVFDSEDSYFSAFWWDEPTAQWYGIGAPPPPPPPNAPPTAAFTSACVTASCTFDGGSSADTDGTIASYHWDFGDGGSSDGSGATAAHTYAQPGGYVVTLTVTDDDGASNSHSETVVVNAVPTASVTFACSGLTCSFDGAGSADNDGAIANYRWSFGDESSASGTSATAQHAYAAHATYTVTLTVTDDDGATASRSSTFTTINLVAQSYKLKGLRKVDLSWTGSGSATFDVFRNGSRIASVAAFAYTDTIDVRGSGTVTYRVCQAAASICSSPATVTY